MTTLQLDRRENLRRSIRESEFELNDAIVDLRRVVEGGIVKFDVRRRIVNDPLPWLTGAFIVGLVFGMRER